MKHLKIYFAVLFFSFLGAANPELMAQSNTAKYGDILTKLRSDNGQYELSVSTSYAITNYEYSFKLVKVDGPTIWEDVDKYYHTPAPNSDFNNVRIGYGCVRIITSVNYVGVGTQHVLLGGNNGQGSGTFLRLHNDGELAIYGGSWRGDGDKVWSSGTCGGVLGGCGAVGAR